MLPSVTTLRGTFMHTRDKALDLPLSLQLRRDVCRIIFDRFAMRRLMANIAACMRTIKFLIFYRRVSFWME